jgi:hypothetical protein
MRTSLLLLVAACLLPAMGRAQEACPWLNQPTAASSLDAPVEMSITHPNADHKGDVTCDYAKQQGGTTRELRIEVRTITKAGNEYAAAVAQCVSKPVVLKAMGNEALTCNLDANKQRTEQAVGRVREHVFIVQIKTNEPAWAPQDALREKVRNVAEITAGNLF